MAAPHRGNTGFGTYFITAAAFQKHGLFQADRMARLFRMFSFITGHNRNICCMSL